MPTALLHQSRKAIYASPKSSRSRGYLADVLDHIHDHKIGPLDELLPWDW